MFKLSSVVILAILLFSNCSGQLTSKVASERWYIEMNSHDIGLVRTFFDVEYHDSTFIACTRKNADRTILGFWKSGLARLFSSDFKHGSLVNITDGKVKRHGDTMLLSAIFRSALGSYYFKGFIYKNTLKARLLNSKKELRGTISGSKALPPQPLCNYSALTDKALQITREEIYNRSVFSESSWQSFEKNIREVAAKVQDDLEMEFAFYYFAGKLPFSHYSLLRTADNMAGSASADEEKQVVLEEKSPETLYMDIKSFSGTAAEMDSAFSFIAKKQYKNLIVDLRNNPGGTVAAGLRFTQHIIDSAFYGGVFLTQRWFAHHNTPPAVSDYNKLTPFSDANFDLIIKGIHEQEGLCLKIEPAAPVFRGRICILTSSITASTCEPIVYWLKQSKRATVVGEKTAGAMLNGEFFKVSDGFSVIIPTADYYAPDGFKIDRNGVEPSVKTEPQKALENVMNLIGR